MKILNMLSYNRSMYTDTDVFNACKNTEKQNYFEDLEKKNFIKCFHRGLRKKKKKLSWLNFFFLPVLNTGKKMET